MNENAERMARDLATVIDERAQPKIEVVHDKSSGAEIPVALVPRGTDAYELKSVKPFLDEYADAPDRRVGTVHLHTLASLIAHVNRAKDPHSVAFADGVSAQPSITVVYDYHAPGQATGQRFGKYRAHYAFPVSEEWAAWRSVDGVEMGQARFAAFLDERLYDVAEPTDAGVKAKDIATKTGREYVTAARLMELAQGLDVHVKHTVKNAVNLSSGEGNLTFAEEHTDGAGAQLRVPRAFLIAVPVFRNGTVYQIPVQIRYRVKDAAVMWTLKLHAPQRAVDDAVTEAAQTLREATELPVFEGTPDR